MKLTNHEEYGLRCLLRLAEQGPAASATIPEISQAEGISDAYAAKLLRILRQGKFVKAARGKIGGYTLARPASEIVIADVIKVLGGPLFEEEFCAGHSGQLAVCVRSADCSLRGLWQSVQAAVDQVLSQTTLANFLRGSGDGTASTGPMLNITLPVSGELPDASGDKPLQESILRNSKEENVDV
jgi:Rrf2 family protein